MLKLLGKWEQEACKKSFNLKRCPSPNVYFVPAHNDKKVDEKDKSHMAVIQSETTAKNKIQDQDDGADLPAPMELSQT